MSRREEVGVGLLLLAGLGATAFLALQTGALSSWGDRVEVTAASSDAAGLQEGDPVARGQVIGYVGTSGNAPKDTPHLHFAIFKLTDAKRWWQGTAVDPYPILK